MRQDSHLALAGLVLLLLAVTAVLLLVTDVLFHAPLAVAVAFLFGVGTVGLWFGPAVLQRRRG